MIYFRNFFWIVFVLEENGKGKSNYGGINGETKPNGMPVFGVVNSEIFIDNIAAYRAAKNGTKTVGHHHK